MIGCLTDNSFIAEEYKDIYGINLLNSLKMELDIIKMKIIAKYMKK